MLTDKHPSARLHIIVSFAALCFILLVGDAPCSPSQCMRRQHKTKPSAAMSITDAKTKVERYWREHDPCRGV